MGLVKTEGIVLRETKYGEHDKMLTVFTKEWGTVSVFARGVRGGKRRCTGAGLFCYSHFVLFRGKNSYQLNECELIRSFHKISDDLVTMACASYFCEIVSGEQLENPNLMKLLLNAFAMLEQGKPAWLVKGVFELRAAGELGFAPELFCCVGCGCQRELSSFSHKAGGVVCNNCMSEGVRISKSVLNAMQYIQVAKNPFSFSLSEDRIGEFSEVCEKFLIHHIEKTPKTLEFLKTLA